MGDFQDKQHTIINMKKIMKIWSCLQWILYPSQWSWRRNGMC